MNYPIPAIQHTRAVVALTITNACLELFRPDKDTAVSQHMTKIGNMLEICSRTTRKKALSAGAKRDMSNCFETLAPYIDMVDRANNEKKIIVWSALIWAALTFVEDAINTAPVYTGPHLKSWIKLKGLVEEMALELCKISAGADEDGTYIYEKAAWALEGVLFEDKEREGRL